MTYFCACWSLDTNSLKWLGQSLSLKFNETLNMSPVEEFPLWKLESLGRHSPELQMEEAGPNSSVGH